MNFSLNTDDKKRIMEQSLNMVESDLYREILAAGLVPEEFTNVASVDINQYPDIVIYGPRISSLIARQALLKEKLANLG